MLFDMLKRKTKKKPLVTAQGSLAFWVYEGPVYEGPVLANLRDLRDALASMDDVTFVYHVNEDKNDFANWVRDVLNDVELSRKLSRTKRRPTAHKTVADHVKANY
jgi:hypothetical protein